MWRYKNCECYDNDNSKMMVMTYDNDEVDDYNGISGYCHMIYIDSLCDDYMLIMII